MRKSHTKDLRDARDHRSLTPSADDERKNDRSSNSRLSPQHFTNDLHPRGSELIVGDKTDVALFLDPA